MHNFIQRLTLKQREELIELIRRKIAQVIENFEVKKAFIKYMYTVFGEEYKTAYMEHVSKLYF